MAPQQRSIDHVVAVIVNYRQPESSLRLATSIRAEFETAGLRATVVIADNSGDVPQSDPIVIERFPNVGFGAAVNSAARDLVTPSTALVVLSHEICFPRGALASLVAALRDPGVAASGPVLVDDDGAVISAGLSSRGGWLIHLAPPPNGKRSSVQALDGGCLAIAGDAWLAIGGFDERYFLYWEDVDLGLRLTQRGRRVLLCADIAIEASTAGGSTHHAYYVTRNHLLFLSNYRLAGLRRVVFAGRLLLPALAQLRRQRDVAAARITGLVDGLRAQQGPINPDVDRELQRPQPRLRWILAAMTTS